MGETTLVAGLLLAKQVTDLGEQVDVGRSGRAGAPGRAERVICCEIHAVPAIVVDDGLVIPPEDGFGFSTCLLRPTSRGKVSLRSLLPSAKPQIVHGYLTTEEDREATIRAVHNLLEIAEQPALTTHRRGVLRTPASDSDADILDYIQRHTLPSYHPVGTCAIGSVVDSEPRVQGVDGLRVVDASVMPVIIRGNTNAPTIMIAEKAADMIRGSFPEANLSRSQPFIERAAVSATCSDRMARQTHD